MVALDYADSAKRFGQTAGNFRVDFRTSTKDGPDSGESFINKEAESEQDAESDQGHQCADAQQDDERKNTGHQAAEKLHQACADEVANAFDVAHDARNQLAGFVRIVVSDWKPPNVRLNPFAHVGNHALGGFGKKLGERVRSDALHDGRANDNQHDGQQQVSLMLANYVIEKIFRGKRQR